MATEYPFEPTPEPWLIDDRLDRMRYLLDYFVWQGSICQILQNGEWWVAKGDKGLLLVPLWPDQKCARQSMGDGSEFEFKMLRPGTIEEEFFEKMYADEYLAVFPNASLEYEIFTVEEFRQAWDFTVLLKKDFEGLLTSEEENRLLSQYRLW